MPRNCITQATCAECGENEDNYTVTTKETDIEEEEITYHARCSCGENARMTLDASGTEATDNVSYEDASWNQEDGDNDN
jgi:hypothetical protein